MILLILSAVLVCLLTLLFVSHLRLWWKLRKLPGDAASVIPFLDLYRSRQRLKKHGKDPTAAAYAFTRAQSEKFREEGIRLGAISILPLVILYRADHAEVLLKEPQFSQKSRIYELLSEWLGNGLLTSNGTVWKTQRRILTPSFHFSILNDYQTTMNKHICEAASSLKKQIGERGTVEIDLSKWSIDYTMEVMLDTVMGFHENDEGLSKRYLENLNKVVHAVAMRFTSFINLIDFIYFNSTAGREFRKALKDFDEIIYEVINRKIQNMREKKIEDGDSGTKKRPAFLDLMVEIHLKENGITLREMKDQVHTFMFAGHDTTGWGIAWTLFQIGHQPDVQRKLCEEFDAVLGSDRDRHISAEELKELKYFECVLKETQRLYPSVPFISRRCIADDAKIGRFEIPKGVTVSLDILSLHRDPNVFPDPEKFDPDRFLPENCDGRHGFAFLPFSAGPRNCIGQKFALQEMRLSCLRILRHFEIRSLFPLDATGLAGEIILRAKNGLPVELTPRP